MSALVTFLEIIAALVISVVVICLALVIVGALIEGTRRALRDLRSGRR